MKHRESSEQDDGSNAKDFTVGDLGKDLCGEEYCGGCQDASILKYMGRGVLGWVSQKSM